MRKSHRRKGADRKAKRRDRARSRKPSLTIPPPRWVLDGEAWIRKNAAELFKIYTNPSAEPTEKGE